MPKHPTAAAADTVWPVLKRYDQDHLLRIAMPIGGIGTGTVSLGGRGDLRDWEIVNQPVKGFVPQHTFFAIRTKDAAGRVTAKALEGALDPTLYEGPHGAKVPNHSLPRFGKCAFAAAYPLAQVSLSDPSMPVDVRLEAFNPMIPADADASGMPVAVLRYVVTNKTNKPVEASVCGNVRNFIGTDGVAGAPKQNVNDIRPAAAAAATSFSGLGISPERFGGSRSAETLERDAQATKFNSARGVLMRSNGVDPQDERWGTMVLATTAASGVSHRTVWAKLSWGDSLLDFWDDFTADGQLDERDAGGVDAPHASLCVKVKLKPRESRAITFLLAWHFPNRMTWSPAKTPDQPVQLGVNRTKDEPNPNRIGNYYATRYADAWDVVARTAPELPRLEAKTVAFVRAFAESDGIPDVVKEAALFNASTLRTQTCFRTDDGRFYGWEGCGHHTPAGTESGGCCHGSCTHVWNYEQATAFLFGAMSRSMREVEFAHCTSEEGHMSFRVNLPLTRAQTFGLAAADGQMGCLMKLYRDWQLSGDEDMLRALWPNAKRALSFCWIPGGWDADRDGVMEGCQHNTMDVEYYGPNPEMGSWYLGALRASEEMARHVGDAEFAATCRDLFERGSAWLDANLFNGEYYEHEIRPITEPSKIARGLRHESMGTQNLAEPELQLGPGCLADQLVGQYMAHVCGLGHLLDRKHVRTTLRSLIRHNYKDDLSEHFNHLRSYALGNEAGLLVATYPRGRRPRRPFPYAYEVWTGLEYTAAAGMLFEGLDVHGLKIIESARARHDGRRRNPFDEPECGHHYARAMASWAAVLATTGFHYSAVTGNMRLAASKRPKSTTFWSTGNAWGTATQAKSRGGTDVEIRVLHGTLPRLSRVTITGAGTAEVRDAGPLNEGQSARVQIIGGKPTARTRGRLSRRQGASSLSGGRGRG